MMSGAKLHQRLREKYGNTLPFKRICADEDIEIQRVDLDDGVWGMYVRVNGYSAILLSSRITRTERRGWAWHELFHHFTVAADGIHFADKGEKQATLFAALCQIPSVKWGDTVESLVEKYQVSPWLAKARLELETKKLTA